MNAINATTVNEESLLSTLIFDNTTEVNEKKVVNKTTGDGEKVLIEEKALNKTTDDRVEILNRTIVDVERNISKAAEEVLNTPKINAKKVLNKAKNEKGVFLNTIAIDKHGALKVVFQK